MGYPMLPTKKQMTETLDALASKQDEGKVCGNCGVADGGHALYTCVEQLNVQIADMEDRAEKAEARVAVLETALRSICEVDGEKWKALLVVKSIASEALTSPSVSTPKEKTNASSEVRPEGQDQEHHDSGHAMRPPGVRAPAAASQASAEDARRDGLHELPLSAVPGASVSPDAERYASWIAAMRDMGNGSDVPKKLAIMTKLALDGAPSSDHALDLLRAYRARSPASGAGDGESPLGSIPNGSVGALGVQRPSEAWCKREGCAHNEVCQVCEHVRCSHDDDGDGICTLDGCGCPAFILGTRSNEATPPFRISSELMAALSEDDDGPSEPVCECGHVRDEHSASGECEVETDAPGVYCQCCAFDEVEWTTNDDLNADPPGAPRPDEATPAVTKTEPRELHCEDCDRDYPVWVAPSPLWNKAVREPSDAAGTTEPFLCLTCFAVRAERAGIVPTAWIVRPERDDDMPQPDAPRTDNAIHKEASELLSILDREHLVVVGGSVQAGISAHTHARLMALLRTMVPRPDSATSVHVKHGVSDGVLDHPETPSVVGNAPKNADKPMETNPADDHAAELFSVERTAAGRIVASASLGAHVGSLLMTETTARNVHRALGIILAEAPRSETATSKPTKGGDGG